MKRNYLLPTDKDEKYSGVTVFLAGSIEQGSAAEWQSEICKRFAIRDDIDVTFFNPRRENWDSSWKQSADEPNFVHQVTWELDHMERCDLIFMYFAPGTKSPISLLELGLHADGENMIVCCPDGFWRKGNVEIVCERYNVPLYDDYEKAVEALELIISKMMLAKGKLN